MFSLIWTGGSLVDPDILRRVFHSDQTPPLGFNRGYYRNADVDRLLDRATQSTNEDERARAYREAQQLIAEDAPYIPIWNRTNVIVAQRLARWPCTSMPSATSRRSKTCDAAHAEGSVRLQPDLVTPWRFSSSVRASPGTASWDA
jgi:ABC-type transport system substrate-binding protein